MSRLVAAASAAAGLLMLHAAVNSRLLHRPPPLTGVGSRTTPVRNPTRCERVSVLVPARDEADRIGPCLRALSAQTGVDLELLVLDDQSRDRTAEVVEALIAGNARARLLHGADVPSGWLGKPHACTQLATAATGTVLVFVDADVVLAADGVARTVALLRGAGLDLVSPYPRQLADGWGPRLVQPLLQWSWMTFVPLRLAEKFRTPSLAVANGQLLAADAEAYRRAGGHAAVRAAVVEDVELARAFVRTGARVAVADGTEVAACRMYEGWPELRDGYTKSLWAAFGSPIGAVAAVALLAWLYVLPPAALAVALARGRPRAALVPLAGTLAGIGGRVVAARRTGGRPGDAVAHPLSVLALGWLAARSGLARRRGTLSWRGRPLDGLGRLGEGGVRQGDVGGPGDDLSRPDRGLGRPGAGRQRGSGLARG